MDRQFVYLGAVPLDQDILSSQRNAHIAIQRVMEQCFGASVTSAGGFVCNPGTGLQVIVQPGQVTTPGTVDDSSYGSLPAISSLLPRSHIMRDQMSLIIPAAGATYSVYAAISQIDGGSVVVPYYNPANPSQTLGGANNSGTAQATVRQDLAAVAIGTSVPTGGVPLWTITVPSGATAITAAMIVQATTAPVFPTIPQLVAGRLIGMRVIASTQVYTPTIGTASIVVEGIGGGGSGAGAAATGASQVSAGSGGGAGGYFRKRITTGFGGATANIGTGGSAASVGAAGNAGQNTSFLGCSATGGAGGSYNQPNTNTVIYPTGGASGGAGTGGDINAAGGAGNYAFYATTASSGKGGASFLGEGGQAITGSGNGATAVTPGSGGSGGVQSVASSAGATGGAGATGLIIITEYT